MTTPSSTGREIAPELPEQDYDAPVDRVHFEFNPTRRQFVQVLGAGFLIAVFDTPAIGQGRGRGRGGRGGQPTTVAARLHLGMDGTITVLTGKVECGQGVRAELTQATAEELRVPADRISLIMADTSLVPNDGVTAGSRSTPSSVPAIRQAAATARELLVEVASRRFGVPRDQVEARDGKAIHAASGREQTYAELAADEAAAEAFKKTVSPDVTLTVVNEWKVLGSSVPRPNRRGLVTGAHRYPSDIIAPGMLYGRILRAPSYGATLTSVDLGPAKAMKDVVAVQDGSFVGVAAPTTHLAEDALQAIAETARWDTPPHPASTTLWEHLRQHARGGVPKNPFADELTGAPHALRQTYHVAYVQHAPMEPRVAVAAWDAEALTVWTGTQNPFGVRSELAQAFRLPEDRVRVIVPDFGGGFGGKHSGETAVEAARLAQAAGRSVNVRWTREEEFTWAYFRPAAVIDAEASLDDQGRISSWYFVNMNSGGSALETPYRVGKSRTHYVESQPPLRHGSYRALASTANTFARECFMDELAEAAGRDALEFRLAHLDDARLRAVLQEAARRFDWTNRIGKKESNVGIGLACGTEKGSFVAACAEVAVEGERGIVVRQIGMAYECGAIINPTNLASQVEGAIVMGLGPALREEMQFENGKILNGAFSKYLVPRFEDVPEISVHLLNRLDLPSVGAGETPIIAVAPAIANAVYRATGKRVREMPARLPKTGH